MSARLEAGGRELRVHPKLSEANPSKLSAQEGAAKRSHHGKIEPVFIADR
jgi:hypothetical protein